VSPALLTVTQIVTVVTIVTAECFLKKFFYGKSSSISFMSFNFIRPASMSTFCSHERVLEAITEEAEKRDIERFQPLLAGMGIHNIALKVCVFA